MTYNRFIQGLKAAERRGRPQDAGRPGRQRRRRVRARWSRSPRSALPGRRQRAEGRRRRLHRSPQRPPAVRSESRRRPSARDAVTAAHARARSAARRLRLAAFRGQASGCSWPRARRRSARPSAAPGGRASSCSPPPRPPSGTPTICAAAHAPRRCRSPIADRRGRRRAGRDRHPAGPGRRRAGSSTSPLAARPRAGPALVVVLAQVRDPGNAGTVIRTADAAGADAVVLADDSVDRRTTQVRAGLGRQLFHLPVVDGRRRWLRPSPRSQPRAAGSSPPTAARTRRPGRRAAPAARR